MMEIDDAIGKVEAIYRSVTGRDAPQVEVPYSPIPAERDPGQHVMEQMDRLTQLLGGSQPGQAASQASAPAHAAPPIGDIPSAAAWTPPLSVWELEGEVLVCIDLPGVAREHVDVAFQENVIVVSGRRMPPALEGQRVAPVVPAFDTFRRLVALPPGTLGEHVTAALKDGVLSLRLPRPRANGARNIAIS